MPSSNRIFHLNRQSVDRKSFDTHSVNIDARGKGSRHRDTITATLMPSSPRPFCCRAPARLPFLLQRLAYRQYLQDVTTRPATHMGNGTSRSLVGLASHRTIWMRCSAPVNILWPPTGHSQHI